MPRKLFRTLNNKAHCGWGDTGAIACRFMGIRTQSLSTTYAPEIIFTEAAYRALLNPWPNI
ncbi:hypothetical protein AG1IA_04253 [Rhizoctonia solani AG-1 IA]|uniref:Uncharacterized protein n=1 Tax=Thanatephorus cucumeris (strain AG1-IA) TaxID=983506 RepID=L8WY77_THACA|nr:hypothetical protein AG1IA_04253 [Rhizoctonia solani AG-1 IA]